MKIWKTRQYCRIFVSTNQGAAQLGKIGENKMTTSINNSAEIKFFVVCFAGKTLNIISSHETKEQANEEYKMKLSLTEAKFYAPIGYVKLYKK